MTGQVSAVQGRLVNDGHDHTAKALRTDRLPALDNAAETRWIALLAARLNSAFALGVVDALSIPNVTQFDSRIRAQRLLSGSPLIALKCPTWGAQQSFIKCAENDGNGSNFAV